MIKMDTLSSVPIMDDYLVAEPLVNITLVSPNTRVYNKSEIYKSYPYLVDNNSILLKLIIFPDR